MNRVGKTKGWMLGAASAAFAMATLAGAPVRAQEADEPIAANEPATAEEIVVPGRITYRNRTEEVAPVLDYGLDYFQRFEPLTVGDMMKRVPSAVFVSDVLEFDGVRLRGLDPGYTQILINGERVPGAGVDRSFWVDRIPAELVERVEIVRSPSANRAGDAVAGALNIVLRDPLSLEGGFVRGGALHFNDGEIEPVFGAVIGGQWGPGRGLLGLNIQGRHNPKEKVSYRYEPDSGVLEFDNREDQSDVRDGTDYSFNGEYALPVGPGELEFSGFYIRTDRTETELSREYGDETSTDDADLSVQTPQFEDILQENYSLGVEYTFPMLDGETQIEVGYASFNEEIVSTEEESEFDPFPTLDDFGGARTFSDQTDDEISLELQHERELGDGRVLEFGVDYAGKERETSILEAEIDTPGDAYPSPDPITGGLYSIEETRLDGYVMASGGGNGFKWEAGVRYETTETEITDRDAGVTYETSYSEWLPSLHLRYDLTGSDRLTVSFARSVRRPNFDYLAPALLEEEPTEDNDFRGNPFLKPESAWGFDVGYEHRIGRSGVVGVNFFYRDIQDLVELASTGEVSSTGDGFVFEPRNVGDGTVYGVEFDLSAPLSVFGWDNTGVFLNYSLLDSQVEDPITGQERRFNDQAKSVLNVGFIQDLPDLAAAFGLSYREQGDAFNRVLGETVATSYGGDLEFFAEKRFGERFVLRFTASNLLDLEKSETFYKWDTLEDQLSGDIDDLDEFEQELESSGPVFQIVGRYAF